MLDKAFIASIRTELAKRTGRPTDRKMTFATEAIEPSGRKIHFDCIVTVKDRDHHAYEMWTKAPNGKRFRNMLVEYVRA